MNEANQEESNNISKFGVIDTSLQLDKKTSNVTLQLTNKLPNGEKPTDWGTVVVTLIIGAAISQLITFTKEKLSDKSKRKRKCRTWYL